MKEEILKLEADFSNNEYFGTNVWTEEKYRTLSGKNKILLSAPHAVNQLRGDDVRDAEKYTGSILRYVCKKTDSFGIFQLFTHSDPNHSEEDNYRNGVVNLIKAYDIKLLIDIHSSTFTDETDIDIVTNHRQTLKGKDFLYDNFKNIASKYNVTVDEKNVPNKEKSNEIITVASSVCDIPCIRIVINNKRLDIEENEEKFITILNTIVEFINDLEI